MLMTASSAEYPSTAETSGGRPLAQASPKSRNWRSSVTVEIAMGSEAPEAIAWSMGAGSPMSF
jgi:hypothetical protein